MVQAFGSECCLCKKQYEPELYDFHHLDPKKKEFGLGAVRGKIVSWKRLVIELRKCVMLCANCHRLVEYGYKKVPNDAIRFDEGFATYELKTIRGNNGEENKIDPILPKYADHLCPICNSDKVLRNNTYCSIKCAGVASRKVKNKPPIEEIKKMVEETSWVAVGKKYGVTDNAVRKWVKRYESSN